MNKPFILLSDLVGYTGGYNPVCVNFGLPADVGVKLMTKAFDEHLGIKIPDEYAEMVFENYSDTTYTDDVVKEIRHLYNSSHNENRKEKSYV